MVHLVCQVYVIECRLQLVLFIMILFQKDSKSTEKSHGNNVHTIFPKLSNLAPILSFRHIQYALRYHNSYHYF